MHETCSGAIHAFTNRATTPAKLSLHAASSGVCGGLPTRPQLFELRQAWPSVTIWRTLLPSFALHSAVEHRWDLSVPEALALQEKLASEVVRTDEFGIVRHVCGIDVHFVDDEHIARAAAAVLSFPELRLCDYAIASEKTIFPYIPGLLSFRETPAALAALKQLAIEPDLLLCDGQGIAHPRRCGLASHIGLLSGIASIGVAKTRLIGEHGVPAQSRGAWAPLLDGSESIGAVLRTRAGVKPVYVSIGHRVTLETAVRYLMACVTRYRLPETTRWAHRLARASASERAALHRSLRSSRSDA